MRSGQRAQAGMSLQLGKITQFYNSILKTAGRAFQPQPTAAELIEESCLTYIILLLESLWLYILRIEAIGAVTMLSQGTRNDPTWCFFNISHIK